MITMTRVIVFASLSLLAAASASGCNAVIADDDTDNSTGDGGEGGSWEPCSSENSCPDGQFCFNGLCALGCQSDGDCADNQYCNTDILLCQNTEVPTCSGDSECASSQICVDGYCTTPPEDTQCNLDDYLNDGCESNAVCLEQADTEQGSCYTMPACAEDGTCPVGVEGAVCNNGLLSTKDEICLINLCEDMSHCPADWNCVRLIQNSPLGNCSSGQLGAPCATGDDCVSGTCNVLPGLSGGLCG